MIRHCVFVKFRSGVSEADKRAVYAKLDALRETIPGLINATFGPNISPEGKSRGFNDGFIMDFEDVAARDVYLEDPDHKAAGGELVQLLDGGRETGLMVFDIEIPA